MHGNLRGRQREYQPTFARLNRAESQHVAQEGAISFRILAVMKKVSAADHWKNLARGLLSGAGLDYWPTRTSP